jgi:hypothetical protein
MRSSVPNRVVGHRAMIFLLYYLLLLLRSLTAHSLYIMTKHVFAVNSSVPLYECVCVYNITHIITPFNRTLTSFW